MADAIRLEISDHDLRAGFRTWGDRFPRSVAKALNRTSFEVLDDLKAHSKQVFEFAGGPTEQFLAGKGAFRFKGAKPNRLVSEIEPNPGRRSRRGEIFAKQERGGVFGPESDGLKFGEFVAIPVAVKRSGRGRVPARLLPARVVKRRKRGSRAKTKGFVAGRAILERVTSGYSRVLFALVPKVDVAPRFEFDENVRTTAVREWPRKMREEWNKLVSSIR